MDVTPKIPDSLLSKVSGYISKETLIEMKQRENAALAMCGGLLGNCYLLAEVVENLMINSLNNFSKEKWFKQDIKCYITKAKEETHITIANSINNSPTDADYMREVADAIYEIIKPDLFKLNNAVWLAKLIMKKYNIPIENVVRHYDITGKYCPGLLGWNDESIYDKNTGKKIEGKWNNSNEWLKFKKRLV